MKHLRWLKIGAGFVAFVGCVLLLRHGPSSVEPYAHANERSTQPASRPAFSALEPYHAVALQLYQYSTARNLFKKHIDEIAALGADSIMLVGHGYQEHAGSNHISLEISAMPNEEQWAEVIGYCKGKGLRVLVMPTVQLTNPRGNEWRGRIKPQDWNVWWAAYYDMVLRLARVCEANGVDVFMVGSELISTEYDAERWKRLIKMVREIYKGRISYSANWDHYERLSFLEDLDILGMTTYHSLIKPPLGRVPTVEELAKAWVPIRAKIVDFARSSGKPILFTEVGYASQEGITSDPWNYYMNMKVTEAGLQEQANAYEAFVQTFEGQPGIAGVVFWEWQNEPPEQRYGYSPKGKPGEKIIEAYFQRVRQAKPRTQAAASAPASSPAGATLGVAPLEAVGGHAE